MTDAMCGRVWQVVRLRRADPWAEDPGFGEPGVAAESTTGGEPAGGWPECGAAVPRARRAQPLRIEWLSNQPLELGDFTWVLGEPRVLVPRALGDELRARFAGFELEPVELLERRLRVSDFKPGAVLPARFLAAARGLVELRVTRDCRPEPDRSTITRVSPPCPVCGFDNAFWGHLPLRSLREQRYGVAILEWVEWWESGSWDFAEKHLTYVRHPRVAGAGLAFTAEEVGEPGFFVLVGERKFILCTDEVKTFLEQRGATNVGFLEAGDVVD
jgi:hypothetical protein